MRHNEIEDGKSYVMVRPGYDREVLTRATKVTIVDREKRFAPRRRFGQNEPAYIEHEPGSPGAEGSDHMLARVVGTWGRREGFTASHKERLITVKPAGLFLAWDDFLVEIERRERARVAKEERDAERREAHTREWNLVADRLEEFFPESVIKMIRDNAAGDPTRLYSPVRKIGLNLEHLQETAKKLEGSK